MGAQNQAAKAQAQRPPPPPLSDAAATLAAANHAEEDGPVAVGFAYGASKKCALVKSVFWSSVEGPRKSLFGPLNVQKAFREVELPPQKCAT